MKVYTTKEILSKFGYSQKTGTADAPRVKKGARKIGHNEWILRKISKAKKEEKFIVINKKYIDRLPFELRLAFSFILKRVDNYIPRNNKYIVCNQDEPYAEEVWQAILSGENQK